MSRFGPRQICSGLGKSLRPLHSALILGVHTGYARHRSPCARTVTAPHKTDWAYSSCTDAAMAGARGGGRASTVGVHVERSPGMHRIDAVAPTAARKVHRQLEIPLLLRHRANHLTQVSRPDAKNTGRSKLRGSGHDIRPGERARGATQWLATRRMVGRRPTHARAPRTVC